VLRRTEHDTPQPEEVLSLVREFVLDQTRLNSEKAAPRRDLREADDDGAGGRHDRWMRIGVPSRFNAGRT